MSFVLQGESNASESIRRYSFALVLDRHHQSLAHHDPSQPNIYGVKLAGILLFRYVSRDSDRLILRPSAIDQPVQLLEIGEDSSLADFIVGRVCFAFAQM